MNQNIAFLELKFGNIYGGPPNFYAVHEVALLVFEQGSNKVFLESMTVAVDVDIVSVEAKVNELGNTVDRVKEVVNMKSKYRRPFDESYQIFDKELDDAFGKLRPAQKWIRAFFGKCMQKYRIRDIVTFDGRRDLFLLEKARVRLDRMNIIDLQKEIIKETNYLFSLNKLAVVTGFDFVNNNNNALLKSNNKEYWMHPIAARQIIPKTASFDAARLLMVYQEFYSHRDDFLMKAALLLNKIEIQKEKEKANNPE